MSDRLRRYAEEGARRDEHPMITFRDGPTGRRAGLTGGPDIWEVAMWIDDLGTVEDPAAELAGDELVTRAQVDAVLAYRLHTPKRSRRISTFTAAKPPQQTRGDAPP